MIKKLASCIREYKWLSIFTPILMIGEVIFEMLIPRYTADLIDFGINAGNMNQIKLIGGKLIVIAFCSMICGSIAAITASYAASGFASNLRHDMFEKIQQFSFANIDHISSSGLVTRMTTDVTNVQMAYSMLLRMAFRGPCTLIIAFAMAFRINSSLAKVLLYAIPVLTLAAILIMGGSMKWFKKMFDLYDKLNNVVQENVRGIRVVKAFVREKFENKKFGKVSDDVYKASMTAELIMSFVNPIMMSVMYTCSLVISWFGAKLVVVNDLTTGKLMSLINYALQALGGFMALAGIFVMLTMSGAAAKRIVEVFNEVPEITTKENPEKEVKDGSISFKNASFAYGNGRNCLENINLDIKSGETIGIIGGTGCGKTSLVQLIPRLYDTNSGCVTVGGIDVKDYDLNVLRKNVAMVLQKNVLFRGTVEDNLLWGNPDATKEQMWQALEWAQAKSVVEGFEGGLDYWIEQGGNNVSGGQRQRLCIARALIANPKILILDDSTSAVDTHTESLIRKAFAENLPNVTKIIIAQRISSVKDADRIIVIDNGRIDGIGSHEELLSSNKIYKEVFESQQKGGDFDEQ